MAYADFQYTRKVSGESYMVDGSSDNYYLEFRNRIAWSFRYYYLRLNVLLSITFFGPMTGIPYFAKTYKVAYYTARKV